jgi:spore coat protein CotH
MSSPSPTAGAPRTTHVTRRAFLGALAGTAVMTACSSSGSSGSSGSPGSPGTGASEGGSSTAATATSNPLFDSNVVHELEMTFEQTAYEEMIQTFVDTGDKQWIAADVVVDGSTYEQVGIRLKGNSSLMGLRQSGDGRGGVGGPGGSASADDPSSLPWLIRFDEFVDGQEHLGYDEIVVRSNNTETSLNEAVGLELVGRADLATQLSFPTRLRVNGSAAALRLVVESPDGRWEERNFEGAGVLYKSESTGDWSYRGDDPAAYEEVFDQETGDANLVPLIELLDFLNNSDDATFASDLADRVEVDAFARYLAVQELIANTDDIDGPGNNSYLRYSADTGRFTVVAWDLNLAFGSMGRGLAGQSGAGGAQEGGAQEGVEPPAGMRPPDGATGERPAGGGPGGGRSNPLVRRFNANAEFAARYDAALADLRASLYASGAAAEILARRAAVLRSDATDVVAVEVVDGEASSISGYFAA